ncbi:MAG: hypothetical protein KIT84_17035 [Labilithrix sp.]|nr:hypothetical protein [Labilithrix sp.]
MTFYRRDDQVQAVMVEINRALYMDERTGDRLESFALIRGRIQGALEALIQATPKL